jgi:predicted MFS family arabinose efflux permease
MAFPILAAIPVVGKLLEKVLGVVDQAVEDKDQAKKLKADMAMAAMSMDHSEFETLIKEQASIIKAEATGQSWLQRNWRPLLMLIIMVIIANNYIFFPYLSLFTTKAVMLDLPVYMWDLIKLGVGGYVVGRSGEKIVKVWKDKQ